MKRSAFLREQLRVIVNAASQGEQHFEPNSASTWHTRMEIMLDLTKILKDFKFSDEKSTDKVVDEIAVAKSLNDDQRAALKTSLAIIETMGEGIVKDLYFSLSEDYASVSIYKTKEEFEAADNEEIKKLKSSVETLTSEKAEIKKASDAKIEKSELEKVEKDSGEKIEKLSSLIEDKDAVEKITKGSVKIEPVPEAIQKQLDEICNHNPSANIKYLS